MNNLIVLVTNIGTLLSTTFILLTLFEMKKSRKFSFLPELSITSKKFMIKDSEYHSINGIQKDSISLNIINIGNEIAKDLTITYKYNIDAFQKLLEPYNVKFTLDKTFLRIDSNYGRTRIDLNHDNYYTVNYIPNDHKAINVDFPRHFQHLIQAFDEACTRGLEGFKNNIPEIKVQIKYKNIQNNKFKKNYTFKLYMAGLDHSNNSFNSIYDNSIIENKSRLKKLI